MHCAMLLGALALGASAAPRQLTPALAPAREKPKNTAKSPEDLNVLVLVCSWMGHADRWHEIKEWSARTGVPALVIASKPLGKLEHQLVDGVLYVDSGKNITQGTGDTKHISTGDDWDRLPEKMIRAYRAVTELPKLWNVTHVIKVDDTDVLNGGISNAGHWFDIDHFDFRDFRKRLYNFGGTAVDYFGPAGWPEEGRTIHGIYHMNVVPKTSYWYMRRYHFVPGKLREFEGGHGYGLSRRALELMSEAWPREKMDDLYHKEVYEDLMTGRVMCCKGVEPNRWVGLWSAPLIAAARKKYGELQETPEQPPTPSAPKELERDGSKPDDPDYVVGELGVVVADKCCYA